jgi:hypothetical protein
MLLLTEIIKKILTEKVLNSKRAWLSGEKLACGESM